MILKWLPFFISSCLLTHVVKADSQSHPFTQEHHVSEGYCAEPTSEPFEGMSLIQTSGGSSEISKTVVNDEATGSRRRRRATKSSRRRSSPAGGIATKVASIERTLRNIDRRVKSLETTVDELEEKGRRPAPRPSPRPRPAPRPPPDYRRRRTPTARRREPTERRRRSGGGGGGGGGGEGKTPTTIPERWVTAHNYYRCLHGAPPIKWDEAFARGAQNWANRGQMSHAQCYKIPPPEGPAGENLASGSGSMSPERASHMWWDESPGSAPNCGGHCTAMLWKAASKLGCGIAPGAMGTLLVCRYGGGNPLPNMAGRKRDQVGRLDNSKKASCKKKWPMKEDAGGGGGGGGGGMRGGGGGMRGGMGGMRGGMGGMRGGMGGMRGGMGGMRGGMMRGGGG